MMARPAPGAPCAVAGDVLHWAGEKRGVMNIGFESALILVLYAAGMAALVLGG